MLSEKAFKEAQEREQQKKVANEFGMKIFQDCVNKNFTYAQFGILIEFLRRKNEECLTRLHRKETLSDINQER